MNVHNFENNVEMLHNTVFNSLRFDHGLHNST